MMRKLPLDWLAAVAVVRLVLRGGGGPNPRAESGRVP